MFKNKIFSNFIFALITTISFKSNFIIAQETVKDNEGNSYKTIKIGEQVWMQENLKTTHYNNGDPIVNIVDSKAWSETQTGAYTVYQNNIDYKTEYGLFYNYYVIKDERKVCPAGWHVPSDSDFVKLFRFYGGENIAGAKMKEKGIKHWLKPNTGAVYDDTFKALAIGSRGSSGDFYGLTTYAYFWTSTETDATHALALKLDCFDVVVAKYPWYVNNGFSVRCIKD